MRLPVLAIALLCALSAQAPVLTPQVAPSLKVTDAHRWLQDLDYLAREMPAQHANLFHTMRREEFDSALASIRERLPVRTRAQVILELERLAALVGDGHTNLSPWRDTVVAFHTLPITIYKFSDGYYVRATARTYESLLGARVTRIGRVPIDSAAALVAPLVGRDNAMGPWMYGPLLLVMPEVLQALGMSQDPLAAEWTFETGQGARTVTLRASGLFPNYSGDADKEWNSRPGWVDLRDQLPTPLWLSRTGETYWFTWIPEGRILYCQLNELQQRGEPIDSFFARALHAADSMGAEKFVLDLRLNGGGNGYLNVAIVRALVRSRYDAQGRLFVITSRRTFSAAEMLIDALESWSNPIFVGEPAASRGNVYGDSKKLVMPNSRVTLRVSTLYWQFWDPRDTRPWISPQIAAPLTVEAYAAGRDPALEAIAHYVPQPPLTGRLKPLLVSGDSAAAWQAVEAFRADPVNAWQVPADSLDAVDQTLQAEGNRDAAALGERLRGRLQQTSSAGRDPTAH